MPDGEERYRHRERRTEPQYSKGKPPYPGNPGADWEAQRMDCRPVQSAGNRPRTAVAISRPRKSVDEVFERSERKEPEVFAALATAARSRRTENHSGGGICIIKTAEDMRIQSLITLASVDSLERFPKNEAFENWKKAGVYYIENGRTKQEMPHYYQFFQDFENNYHRFDVERSMEMAKAHILIVHGTSDEAVSVKNADHLHILNPNSELFIVENANHTFGAKEPWNEDFMPYELANITERCIEFLNQKIVN